MNQPNIIKQVGQQITDDDLRQVNGDFQRIERLFLGSNIEHLGKKGNILLQF